MPQLALRPTHAPVRAYYKALDQFGKLGFDNEGNIRGAFEDLLKKCCSQFHWTLVPEYRLIRKAQHPLRIDGALIDEFHLPRGYWEAKDTSDDLDAEIQKKFAAGYPRSNILFQEPSRAVLVQNGVIANPRREDQDITQPEAIVRLLHRFFEWQLPEIQEWDRAVQKFSDEIPRLAEGVIELIEAEKKTNRNFQLAFGAFAELCRQSINPDLRDEAVEEMLVQHLLTERIFRRIFKNSDFRQRNVIAAEIEKVIDSLTSRHFSRDEFLKELDAFYAAIEKAADSTTTYAQKQQFLNHVYERFFQGFSKKQADTHGIVYTPQPIVDFMVRSVEEVLKTEFGRSLADQGVHILDPFTGTGNFITRIMQEIPATKLEKKYEKELHCNEVMLLPYYIASMNIEHAYFDKVGHYKSFEGICLADTFDTTGQAGLFSTENTKRIRRQIESPIRIVLGNPPYNMGQTNESDENKNRAYTAEGGIDSRIAKTYTAASKATLRNKLSDPYVKAFRWATDRIKDHGIVCFVSNNSFIDQIAFDGMRRHLSADYCAVYILDLGGNVRKNPKLSGSTHNVFGIQVGVAITLLIRHTSNDTQQAARIFYTRMPTDWRKTDRLNQLDNWQKLSEIKWERLRSDGQNNWIRSDNGDEFGRFISLGNKVTRGMESTEALFRSFSLGIVTSRDSYAYSFQPENLTKSMASSVSAYLAALSRFIESDLGKDEAVRFVDNDDVQIKWTRQLKAALGRKEVTKFNEKSIRPAAYRPYTRMHSYYEDFWNEEHYRQNQIYPLKSTENIAISATGIGAERPFASLAANVVPDLNFFGPGTVPNWFPFYTYNEDGTNRRENITDWALNEFRNYYTDSSITKWDIFHYTYALLHHPEYRTRYAVSLKRELPRIPYAPDFPRYAALGKELMDLHIHYEQQPEYPLERIETGKLTWRVDKMKLAKDKIELRYNSFLTLRGIPPEVSEYRLGNRSALEWIVDQYQVSTDKRSGIVNDPNREDDPEYILRLIGQVIHVSVETVKRTRELATLALLPVASSPGNPAALP